MKKISIIILLLCITIESRAYVQQQKVYPYLWKVIVQAQVSVDTTGDKMFYYSYVLINHEGNLGNIQTLEIDVSRDPSSIEIDTIGLRFRHDGYTEKFAREDFVDRSGKIIPVGFLGAPTGDWDAAYTNDLTADFSVVGDYILPGQRLGGFLMMSKGLPGIRRCIVSPRFDVDELFPNPEEDTTITGEYVDSIREAVKYRGWTVGPTAPPKDFFPSKWYEILTDYTVRSLNLGWIKSQQTADKYLAYFTTAKQELEKNDTNRARAIFQNVLRDVDIDSTSNLTSEAYALLRYNTEYLLEQIP